MERGGAEKNRIAVSIYYGIRGLLVVAFLGFLLNRNWVDAVSTALIFLLMLAPSFLGKRYRFFLPFELDVAVVVFIFLTLFLGSLRDFYERFSWWDDVLHFQSGLLLGVIGFVLVYILNEQKSARLTMGPGFVAFFSFCFSLALSVVWEVYEFAADSWFGFMMQRNGLPDTMGDLIVNLGGAGIVAILGYLWMRRRGRIPFAPSEP